MEDELSYFEQAAEALSQAFRAPSAAEQYRLIEKAQRLRQLAIAQERAKLAGLNSIRSALDQKNDRAP